MDAALAQLWQELVARPDFWGFICIPIVAAIVTWAHVWWALKMVFYPLDFVGLKTPKLDKALGLPLPLFGWQGIIPRKARKMSNIVVDNVISKMGTVADFIRQMEPEKIAAYVARAVDAQVEAYTDDVLCERNQIFWENLPLSVKKSVYAHVRKRLPGIMDNIVQSVIHDVDQLVDVKEMLGNQLEADRGLVVRIFQEVGDREFRFIVNASFWIGLVFGVVQMVLFYFIPWHGMLPIYAAILGLLTNWLALAMVFQPLNPVRVGPFTLQGLFLRRQDAVSEKFAELVSLELLTVHRFMREMLTGKHSARAHLLIKRHVATLVDSAPLMRMGAQATIGLSGYAALKQTIATKSADMALEPLANAKFNRERAQQLATLFASKMKTMSSAEFQDLLRPAFHEDEWILLLLGAVTGLIAGTAQWLLGFA